MAAASFTTRAGRTMRVRLSRHRRSASLRPRSSTDPGVLQRRRPAIRLSRHDRRRAGQGRSMALVPVVRRGDPVADCRMRQSTTCGRWNTCWRIGWRRRASGRCAGDVRRSGAVARRRGHLRRDFRCSWRSAGAKWASAGARGPAERHSAAGDGSGLGPVVAGTILGLLGGAALSRAVAGLLFDVNACGSAHYIVSGAVILVASAAATWLPARRACRVDLSRPLRAEYLTMRTRLQRCSSRLQREYCGQTSRFERRLGAMATAMRAAISSSR